VNTTEKKQARQASAPQKKRGPSRRAAPEGVLLTRVLAVVGLVVAAVGLATGLVTEGWRSAPVVAMLVVALALVILFFMTNWRWLVHVVATRRALIRVNVVISVAVATGILVMVNVISYRQYWRHDFSESQIYQLSSQTRNILKNLDQDVKVVVFYHGGTYEGLELYNYLTRLLAEYSLETDHLSTTFINQMEDPLKLQEQSQKYEVTEGNVVVVVAGEQRKTISSSELITSEPTGRGPQGETVYRTTYFGEPALTGAIKSVTDPEQKKVYFLSGHKEHSTTDADAKGYAGAARALRNANYEVAGAVNLVASGDVPEDCDLLIIAGPRQPLRLEEVDALTRYLDKGKPALFLVDPVRAADYSFLDFGFEPLLAQKGIKLTDALVIDTKSSILFTPQAPVPASYSSANEITAGMKNVTTAFSICRPLEPERQSSGVNASWLIRTSEASWGETNLQTEDSGTPTGGGSNVLEDTTKNWRPDQWAGAQLILLTFVPDETGQSGTKYQQSATVVSNTATALSIQGKFDKAPDGKKTQQYVLRKGMAYDEGQDAKGPLTLAMASGRNTGGRSPMDPGPGEMTDRVVVVGDSDFASNDWIEFGNNRDFFLNCVSWLAGKPEDIGLRPKNPELADLSLNSRQFKAVTWVILVAMPAAVILLGCFVWWLRRLT